MCQLPVRPWGVHNNYVCTLLFQCSYTDIFFILCEVSYIFIGTMTKVKVIFCFYVHFIMSLTLYDM